MENKGLRIEELRATNYVRDFEGKEDEVVGLGNFSYSYWLEEDWSAIPLTEEWLEKLGFIQQDFKHSDGSISKNIFIKGKILVERPFGWQKNNDEDFIVALKTQGGRDFNFVASKRYVHELQNLYFALTDEELLFSSGA